MLFAKKMKTHHENKEMHDLIKKKKASFNREGLVAL
jgi:hypothetical protein